MYLPPHMSYGMVESHFWITYAHGVSYVHNQPLSMNNLILKLQDGVHKISRTFKRYVMYGEHLNGGMIEIDSYNIDFLKDEFPAQVK